MMTVRLQIILGVLILIMLGFLIGLVRGKKVELKYGLVWIAAGIGVFILDLAPGLINWLAKQMGIAAPVNMLFLLGFLFSLMIIFSLTVALSRLSVRVKELAQALALYENEKTDE